MTIDLMMVVVVSLRLSMKMLLAAAPREIIGSRDQGSLCHCLAAAQDLHICLGFSRFRETIDLFLDSVKDNDKTKDKVETDFLFFNYLWFGASLEINLFKFDG